MSQSLNPGSVTPRSLDSGLKQARMSPMSPPTFLTVHRPGREPVTSAVSRPRGWAYSLTCSYR